MGENSSAFSGFLRGALKKLVMRYFLGMVINEYATPSAFNLSPRYFLGTSSSHWVKTLMLSMLIRGIFTILLRRFA